jgi:hypothetical protein
MSAEIFVDPFEEAAEKVKKDRDAETAKHSQTKTGTLFFIKINILKLYDFPF